MKKLIYLAVFTLAMGACSMAKAVQLVDVPEGHWAADAVQLLVDEGLIVGYPDGTFRGEKPMTRYEYAMVVQRMVDFVEANYCNEKKGECKGTTVAGTDMAEVKALLDKLSAEFKDELAALKKQVDKNTEDIIITNKRIDNLPLANVEIDGWVRQRVDVVNSDLDAARLGYLMNVVHGVGAGGALNLDAGYEFDAGIMFKDAVKDNKTDWQVTLSRTLNNQAFSSSSSPAGAGVSELTIQDAWVSIDFSEDIRELDLMKITSGYQPVTFGYYGALVDTRGVDSMAGMRMDIGKDIVELNMFAGLAGVNGAGATNPAGLGSDANDPYAAVRLGLDLAPVKIGVNFLASGLVKEKGWGVDVEADLLKNSPFLKKLRGEYFTITDDVTGASTGGATNFTNNDDSSFIVGLDVYGTKKVGVTVSYADIPAIPAFTGVDVNPYAEYDTVCPTSLGLDVNPTSCYNRDDTNVIFPAGFKGVGVEASYIVFGDVKLAATGVFGDFAGGAYPATWGGLGAVDPEGRAYPGYGTFSVTKPINKVSDFKVEYMQQGADPIIFNRVRGELLINF
jgi:hypothetical protein